MYPSPLTQAFHTYRINLSPFTKDFRVWGAFIENSTIYLRLSVDSYQKTITLHLASYWHCRLLLCKFGMSTGHSIYFSISMFQTKIWLVDWTLSSCLLPYHVEYTSSRLITEVKQHWAELVLGWVTAWEYSVL